MADLISEAKVPLLPLHSRPQYMLLRYTPTCMLHVCSASDRISCNFDSMTEIMAERSCRKKLLCKSKCPNSFSTCLNIYDLTPRSYQLNFFAKFIISLPNIKAMLKIGRHVELLHTF